MCGFVRSEQCAPAGGKGASARERMPVMYAISSDNGGRASQPGPERPELPILFHLMDVSRPRAADSDLLSSGASVEQAKREECVSPAVPNTTPAIAELRASKTAPYKLLTVPSSPIAKDLSPPVELVEVGVPIELK